MLRHGSIVRKSVRCRLPRWVTVLHFRVPATENSTTCRGWGVSRILGPVHTRPGDGIAPSRQVMLYTGAQPSRNLARGCPPKARPKRGNPVGKASPGRSAWWQARDLLRIISPDWPARPQAGVNRLYFLL